MAKQHSTQAQPNDLTFEAYLALRSMACIAGELIDRSTDERTSELLHAIRALGDMTAEKLSAAKS